MERLMALYNIASPSGREKAMVKFITAELGRMNVSYTRDNYGNIYAVKGNNESYPCIVSHTDEVHRRRTGTYSSYLVGNSMIVGYDHKNKKITGIGADDKNGIWICLKCLEEFKVMKCAFFVQEEIGCVGSSHADMTFFTDCRFVVQCDRKGNRDIITRIHGTEICSPDFLKRITPEKYGYRPEHGLNTDVYALKNRGLELSCINLSCGYYQPHTDNEYTIIEDLYKCYRFVRHIICCHREVSVHKTKEHLFPEYQEIDRWMEYHERRFAGFGQDMNNQKNNNTHEYETGL